MRNCKDCQVELCDINWSNGHQAFNIDVCKKCCNIQAQINKRNYIGCKYCLDKLILGENWKEYYDNYKRYICNICENKIQRFSRNKKRRNLGIPKQKIYNDEQRRLARQMRSKIWSIEERQLCLNKYGSVCNCCGISDWPFLTIDHINNNGADHRRSLNKLSGVAFYRYLRENDYPTDNYQILCNNCNSAKGYHGFCPHSLNDKSLCSFCHIKLSSNNMFHFNIKFNHSICDGCILLHSRKNNNNSISKRARSSKNDTFKTKMNIIENYGGECVCCGESEAYFLGIDHIYGGGGEERKCGMYGINFYRWLIKNKYPKNKYQLLCFNCNMSKGSGDKCCHDTMKNKDGIINIDEYLIVIKTNYIEAINNAA